jgi:general secretion pathway protein D
MMFGSIVSWTEEEPTEAAVLDADRPLFVRTFGVSYANVHQLEPILTPLLSGQGSLSVDSRTNCIIVKDTEPAIRSVAQTIVRLDAAMPSHTFHLNYADAEAIADKIRRMFGVSARIVEPDQRTHSVNVVANAATLKELRWLVKQWDKPAPQVLIEADILDVSSAKLKELGIEWELRLGYNDEDAVISVGTGRTSTDTPPTGSITFGTPTVVIPAVYDLMGNLITPEQVIPGSDFSAVIEALVEDRSTRTLSRPRILVLDGHAARFEVSTSEPYANTSYSESGAATSLDIQFLDIGIILETTPHITDDGYVVLNIKPEVSTLERDEFFETTVIPDEGGAITNRIRVPVKTQNRAETVVTVRDNHTIAIGGLRTSSDTESVRKVPILGDIPILGIPFRNLNQGKDDRELIIFITPHIVPGDVSSPEARLLRGNESDTAH